VVTQRLARATKNGQSREWIRAAARASLFSSDSVLENAAFVFFSRTDGRAPRQTAANNGLTRLSMALSRLEPTPELRKSQPELEHHNTDASLHRLAFGLLRTLQGASNAFGSRWCFVQDDPAVLKPRASVSS
jgi:phosphoketolase